MAGRRRQEKCILGVRPLPDLAWVCQVVILAAPHPFGPISPNPAGKMVNDQSTWTKIFFSAPQTGHFSGALPTSI